MAVSFKIMQNLLPFHSRNPFPPGEKIVAKGREYICQRCNAKEQRSNAKEPVADVRGQRLEGICMYVL